jgi:hypothetical protein
VGDRWVAGREAVLVPATAGFPEEGSMSFRYEFVKDPKDRQWIARWQAAAVVAFLALLVAMIVYGPTPEEAVARGDHPPPAATQPTEPSIGRGEGA